MEEEPGTGHMQLRPAASPHGFLLMAGGSNEQAAHGSGSSAKDGVSEAVDHGAIETELHQNSEQQTHNPTEPLAHDKALTLIKELRPLTVQEGVIHAFHAMGGLPEETSLKLTISLEAPRKTQIRQALNLLRECCSS